MGGKQLALQLAVLSCQEPGRLHLCRVKQGQSKRPTQVVNKDIIKSELGGGCNQVAKNNFNIYLGFQVNHLPKQSSFS